MHRQKNSLFWFILQHAGDKDQKESDDKFHVCDERYSYDSFPMDAFP